MIRTRVLANYAALDRLSEADPAKLSSLHNRISYYYRDRANCAIVILAPGISNLSSTSHIRIIRILGGFTGEILDGPWVILAYEGSPQGQARRETIRKIVAEVRRRFPVPDRVYHTMTCDPRMCILIAL